MIKLVKNMPMLLLVNSIIRVIKKNPFLIKFQLKEDDNYYSIFYMSSIIFLIL